MCGSEHPGGGDESAGADKLLKNGEPVQGDVGWKLSRGSLTASKDPTSWSRPRLRPGLGQKACPGLGQIEDCKEEMGRHGSHWSDNSSSTLYLQNEARGVGKLKS